MQVWKKRRSREVVRRCSGTEVVINLKLEKLNQMSPEWAELQEAEVVLSQQHTLWDMHHPKEPHTIPETLILHVTWFSGFLSCWMTDRQTNNLLDEGYHQKIARFFRGFLSPFEFNLKRWQLLQVSGLHPHKIRPTSTHLGVCCEVGSLVGTLL